MKALCLKIVNEDDDGDLTITYDPRDVNLYIKKEDSSDGEVAITDFKDIRELNKFFNELVKVIK